MSYYVKINLYERKEQKMKFLFYKEEKNSLHTMFTNFHITWKLIRWEKKVEKP